MEIRASARKHGIADDDIRHAIEHCAYTATIDEGESPIQVLYLEPDRGGNLIELLSIQREDESEFVVHAMKMRRRYYDLLLGRGR